MNILGLLASLVQPVPVRQAQAVEWEHGYKTDYVVATRYNSKNFGWTIGFQFPKQPYDCDRAETFDFIEQNGGRVYQGGGYPGAEVFAVFDGATDKESASAKLREFLPKLDRHMRGLR